MTVAAAALRCSEGAIRGVIDRDPGLRSVYGTTGKELKARMPQAPTHEEILDRTEDDLPPRAAPGEQTGVELLELVSAAEKEIHMKGLAALEVNEKTLQKLRRLDGLASSTGSFIAIGLEQTHRLYYLAVVDLKTVADQIKERYLDPALGTEGSQVGADLLPFYYRNYIDSIKEFGRAYDLFIQGAAVILKIVAQANGHEPATGKTKAKLGFTGRSVRHANRTDAQD